MFCKKTEKENVKIAGFTLVELMIVVAVLGILALAILPSSMQALPRYRLKSAARDLVAIMHRTRINAIKEDREWQIVFNTGANNYAIVHGGNNNVIGGGDDVTVETVNLARYGSGVAYGWGNAGADWNAAAPVQRPNITFSRRGFCGMGSTFITNQENTVSFAITTTLAGSVKLRQWNGIGQWDD